MKLSDEQKLNIRLNLAVQMKEKSVQEIEEYYKWVVGSESNIVPVSSFQVKQN